MGEISTKALIIILGAVIFLAVVGTIINLNMIKSRNTMPEITGKSTQGIVELKVNAFVAIAVTSAEINFGSGGINQTTGLSTEQANPGTFNPCIEINGTYNATNECRGLQIENIGNVYINLTMASSEDGDSFFFGNNATDEFRFAVVEGNLSRNYTPSCKLNGKSNKSLFPEGTNYTTGFMNWTAINKSFIYTICHNLSFSRGENSLVIEVNLTIPADEADYNSGHERTAQLSFVAETVE